MSVTAYTLGRVQTCCVSPYRISVAYQPMQRDKISPPKKATKKWQAESQFRARLQSAVTTPNLTVAAIAYIYLHYAIKERRKKSRLWISPIYSYASREVYNGSHLLEDLNFQSVCSVPFLSPPMRPAFLFHCNVLCFRDSKSRPFSYIHQFSSVTCCAMDDAPPSPPAVTCRAEPKWAESQHTGHYATRVNSGC